MRFDLPQIAVVTDMVANAIFIDIGVTLGDSREFLNGSESFEDRAGVFLPATQVVHLSDARILAESQDHCGHILGVDIVANLLAFVAKNLVLPLFNVAPDQVTQKAVQLDAGVIRPR